ncbi:MAG: hypothetical protein WCI84_04515 [Bacteroidota bacterium]
METGFHLAKWYFDCITDGGEVCIGYVAVIRIKKFTLHYTSVLCGDARNTITSSTSLRSSVPPELNNDTVKWLCNDLHASGSWKRKFDPVERTLLENEQGSIRWSCIMPGAEAEMQVGNIRLHGLGYVEFLEMTIPPWKLPIEELRWGRFVSTTDAVVWIDWRGDHPLRFVTHNGTEIDCSVLDDTVVSSRDNLLQLQLDRSMVIRSGPIINTALKKIPGIELVVPANILHTDECKWVSRGTLLNGGHHPSTGFAVHEIVRFV